MPKKEISFRNTTRDMKILNRINQEEKCEQSEFVRDAVEFYMEYLENKNRKD